MNVYKVSDRITDKCEKTINTLYELRHNVRRYSRMKDNIFKKAKDKFTAFVKNIKSKKAAKPKKPRGKIATKAVNILKSINDKPVITSIVMAIVYNFVIEALSRQSIKGSLEFVIHRPYIFLLDTLIILVTLMLALLIKRRLFLMSAISIVWLGLGVVNYCILSYRVTPFSAVDIKLLKSVFSIMNMYLTKFEFGLIVVAIGLLIIGTIVLLVKVPKTSKKINYAASIAAIFICFILYVAGDKFGVSKGLINVNTGNISYTYDECGFTYCFINSIYNVGMKKPYEYNEENVAEIRDDLMEKDKIAATGRPNIIFIQLETFFDVKRLKKYTWSENPTPVFDSLKKDYSSGFLNVPALGAGTINTEFEILTGMNLDYFGFCEYPYKTILKKTTCESLCYNLQELGYSSFVIHNNRGNFYSRNKIFPMLGFNNFISIEYMKNLEYNPTDWAQDKVFLDEIPKALDSTDKQDFIYAITVQSHGKYPETKIDEEQPITLEGESDEALKNQYEYYANQLHEVDQVVGELLDELSKRDEDVVVVMYGDHLPTFDISDEDLTSGTIHDTEYVIWDNMDMEQKDQDLTSYQLSAEVLQQLGFDNGLITKLHQQYIHTSTYEKKLDLLQYDMLYGERYVYNGVNPYDKTKMTMGIDEISITEAYNLNDGVYVKGKNFTDFSYVYINGTKMDTEFCNNQNLVVHDYELKEGDRVVVKQLAGGKSSLSKTAQYIYQK